MSTAREKTYRRFLLGVASEEEESHAEQAILAGDVDDSFLHDVEDELIDDYLLGKITREERYGFTAYFLSVDERRERVAFAAALIEYARKHSIEQLSLDRKPAQGNSIVTAQFWRRFALLATAASILLAGVVGSEYVKLRQQQQVASETRSEITGLRSALSSGNSGPSHPDTSSLVSVAPSPTGANWMPKVEFGASTRGVSPVLLRVPAKAQFVQIDLKLSSPLAEKYREVLLASTGEQLWAQEFPASILPTAHRSVIVLPAAILQPGLYHFQVKRRSGGGQFELSEDHVFRVAKE